MEQKTKGGEQREEGGGIDRGDEDRREKAEWTVGRKKTNRGGGKQGMDKRTIRKLAFINLTL